MEASGRMQKMAWLALVGAALLLVGSIVYASLRNTASVPAPRPTPSAEATPAATIETLEERVRATPNDAAAWAALGEARIDRGEFAQAEDALRRATRLDPKGPGYWSGLGMAIAYGSEHDPMPPAALDAFKKANALDPKDPRARYFLATKKDLSGDHKGALDDWFALLADTPPGAPWEEGVRRTITQVGAINKIDVAGRLANLAQPAAAAGLPGPTADQLQAASGLTPGQQEEMARGMVAKLETRLQADPRYLDGWMMLMRSRMTLGEPARASAALKAAVAANPGAKAELEGQARALGVPQ